MLKRTLLTATVALAAVVAASAAQARDQIRIVGHRQSIRSQLL